MKTFETLYKRTSTGAVQIWFQEIEGNSWRTVSGQIDGLKVTSSWHDCEVKNTGKKNATTAEQQAILEVEAHYKKRKELGYFDKIENIDDDIYFKPMLAKKFEDYQTKIKFPVYSQPKLDGMRCVVTSSGMFSRNGKKILSAPHIFNILNDSGVWDEDDSLVFDGELYNHELKDDFNEIMSLARQTKPTEEDLHKSRLMLQYHIYDLYSDKDNNFVNRNSQLSKIIPSKRSIVLVDTFVCKSQDDIDEIYSAYMKNGYEGQIIRTNSLYENKRSSGLLKRKEFIDEEFVLIDIVEGIGNRSGMAGYAIIQLPSGLTCESGIKGSHHNAKQLLRDKNKYIGGDVTVRFFGYTPAGKLRFPVAVYFYVGKRKI